MNLYSKISLFALLAAGSLVGMEQPPLLRSTRSYEGQARLKAPASSAAAQAINQPMIKVFSDTQQIDSLQRNYLEASTTLKNMLQDVDAHHTLVLPESMIEDYKQIKDLLADEYRFNAKTTDEKTITNLLNLKTNEQLVAIANACQRFELTSVSECALAALAEKLNNTELKEKCLRNGSCNLNWTPDVGRLVAKSLAAKLKLVLHCTVKQAMQENKLIFKSVITPKRVTGARATPNDCVLEVKALMKEGAFSFISDEIYKKINDTFYKCTGHDTDFSKMIVSDPNSNSIVLFSTKLDHYYIFNIDQQIIDTFTKLFSNLTPVQALYLEYLIQLDAQKRSPLINTNILAIDASLPDSFIQFGLKKSSNSWWQCRNLFSKTAIITGGIAATGLAAWLGYKYFSKK
ncbi:hypothetical protein BH09DEP1_BH09DEP1_6880 [soil metagenome]